MKSLLFACLFFLYLSISNANIPDNPDQKGYHYPLPIPRPTAEQLKMWQDPEWIERREKKEEEERNREKQEFAQPIPFLLLSSINPTVLAKMKEQKQVL